MCSLIKPFLEEKNIENKIWESSLSKKGFFFIYSFIMALLLTCINTDFKK